MKPFGTTGFAATAVPAQPLTLYGRWNVSLCFSTDGPEFPNAFVDSLLSGDVVFLCGTGVSAPQMPDFRHLVESTYEALGVERTDSEESAFKEGLFEEVLGSLSRRLSDPYAVTRTVSELLAVPDRPNLSQHCTIVRLSRDLENRTSVVTTNFDTLLERAAGEVMPDETPGGISFAGQALPAPGSPSFSGIIHIHGRLADGSLGLELTPLVIKSADYGDAYMRSGWASRFLFDLARCKTILLVGYSASDAPVRYFLNVLEADRARFPDLKPVYALAAYERDPEEATRSWGTLAVEPLPYCKINSDTGKDDHSPLWRDLVELADVAERPKHYRQKRARAILERPVAEADAISRKVLSWLFAGHRDLWPEVLEAITDPEWFKVFQEEGLWSTQDAAWVISVWVSRDFQDRDRLGCAFEWQRHLGRPFTEEIERQLRLQYAAGLDETWARAWHLFCLVGPLVRQNRLFYETRKRLESGAVLYSDLRKTVSLLAPSLVLSQSHREVREDNGSEPIRRFGDIVRAKMAIADPYGVESLIDILCAMPDRARHILGLATAELRSAVELEAELDLIGEDHDINDFDVPSVEKDAQNEHHEGVIFLVRALSDSLPQATALDREYTRGVVRGWTNLPGRIGLRLCLHSMRDAGLFDADEAMSTLLSASDIDFWTIRREIALLLKDRARTASPALVRQVEERIRQTSDAYYDRYTIEPGTPDWRAHARDTVVWLRLNMLQDAGVLSETGAAELSAIKVWRDHLNRKVEDRDFFGTYSAGFRRIEGNPVPIIEAPEYDRLRVARELSESPDIDLREGWSAFCRSDSQGAFDSLCKTDITAANGALWNEFFHGLASGSEASKEVRDNLSIRAFDHLSKVDSEILMPMVSGLSDLIRFGPRQRIADVDGWLERLWEIVSGQPDQPLDLSSDLYDEAINSVAGRLTEALLREMESKRQQDGAATDVQRQLVRRIAGHEGPAGQLGRAVLTHTASFLLSIERNCVSDILGPRISAPDREGATLRAVMLDVEAVSPEITRLLGEAVQQGVIESEQSGHAAARVASHVLRPAVAEVRGEHSVQWGLTASDVAIILREARPDIRSGALDVLAGWLQSDDEAVENKWSLRFKPFFEKVWPKEREFREPSLTANWIALAVGAGNGFPAALEQLQPYIAPFQGDGSLYSIVASKAPERFPRETLRLLWLVCGPNSSGSFYEISEIIDRLIKTDSAIAVDRRLQWLEQRAQRIRLIFADLGEVSPTDPNTQTEPRTFLE